MTFQVQCVCCTGLARHYYMSLDGCLWAVCPDHTEPFRKTMVELHPSAQELEDYYSDDDEDDYYEDDGFGPT